MLSQPPLFYSFVADVVVDATADVGSTVIKDIIADVAVAAGALYVYCGILNVKDEVSKLKFNMDLPLSKY